MVFVCFSDFLLQRDQSWHTRGPSSVPVPRLVIIGDNSHAKEMSNKKQVEKGK